MKEEIHSVAAKEHFKTAENYDKKMKEENNQERKVALRTVAAHNYFYAGINAIEAVFARKDIHSFNHENRNSNMLEHSELFDDELYKLYDRVDRNLRNKVAYRGFNGEMYVKLKLFATKAVEAI